ncbi:MAG TPA: DUF4861 domain-containing protein [Cyclobacteriaceae bacterium]|nr:DUF4861 domain-containing protein [Cyclobacteriaceae bacterium]
MKNILYILLSACLIASCASPEEKEFPESFTVSITNPLDSVREQVMIFVGADKLKSDFNPKAFIVIDEGKEIGSQYNNSDTDLKGIVFVVDHLHEKETKTVTVRYKKEGESKHSYTKRTQAELSHKINGEWKEREYIGGEFKNVDFLRVPPEHKDHSWFIRYEGPGWESDKVGYRFYLDQRNAVDVFGKTVPEVVLQKAGLDGFDSYHELQPWGMDVLKVAKSLGVGSIGYLRDTAAVRVEVTDSVTSRITENGDVYSSILTNYYGWNTGNTKTDLASRLSIHAGTRATHNLLTVNNDVDNLCTGLIKDANGKLFSKEGDETSYGYIATYGKQSLNKDNLGIAVLFKRSDLIELTKDQYSHIVKLKPSNGKLDYYFVAAWEKEPGGIKTEEQFVTYLDKLARELANPVQVEVNVK